MRRLAAVIVAGGIFVALPGAPARATPPEDVLIEVDTTLPPEGPSFGPFTATGPICPTGDSVDVFSRFVGFQSGREAQILVGKEFTCDDGSGSFLLLMQVHLEFQTFTDAFSWTVLDGTGAYETLHGSGDGFGVPTNNGVFDTFSGEMHVE